MRGKWERLILARKENNFTQQFCADFLHVSRNTWANWEMGIYEPSLEDLCLISSLLDVSIDYLLGNDKYVTLSLQQRKEITELANKVKDIVGSNHK
ncbi:MAG TPA: hypothetical protein DEF61_02290 [Firmicutes bacterium]|nr:hypothetical protein [Bacillota bacterium]HBM70615.1 hypothetical protein [Bacillota bacterium]HBX25098.1 hypothetical protein [Bacillota bacterium]